MWWFSVDRIRLHSLQIDSRRHHLAWRDYRLSSFVNSTVRWSNPAPTRTKRNFYQRILGDGTVKTYRYDPALTDNSGSPERFQEEREHLPDGNLYREDRQERKQRDHE